MIAGGTQTVGLVQQFIERTGQLYSLPGVAAEVLRLTSEPQIDARLLRQCIESDPALAARLLRVVNSSLFGPTRQVTDLNQALTLLGIRPLKMLVLGFSLPKELFAGVQAEVLGRYWRRTLVKAIAARELCEQFWRTPGDEPFLAGLVQDIGILALIQQLGSSYIELLGHLPAWGGALIDQELETLGFDHRVLSARLLSHWGMPAGLCAAISIAPSEAAIGELTSKERTLPEILHLAEMLAGVIEQPEGTALGQLLAVGKRYCGLTYELLEPIVRDLQRKVNEFSEVLSLQVADDQSYVDLILTAQARLADETVAVAAKLAVREEDRLLSVASNLRQEIATVVRGRGSSRGGSLGHGEYALAPGTQSSQLPVGQLPVSQLPVSQLPVTMPARARVEETALRHFDVVLGKAIHRCRNARLPMTLALFEIDRFSDLLLEASPVGMSEIAHALACSLADWTEEHDEAVLLSDSRLAMIWENCSRSEAVRRARECLAEVRQWSREHLALHRDMTLSIGVATLDAAPKNYPPRELMEAAERCLSAAGLSGGDTAKSIAF